MNLLKFILLILSIVGLFFIGYSVKKPFWESAEYQKIIYEFPKEGQYLPYRIRKIVWGNWIVIKNISERTLTWIWFDKFFGVISFTLIYAFYKKKYWSIALIISGVCLAITEMNPDTATSFRYMIPSIINVFIQ